MKRKTVLLMFYSRIYDVKLITAYDVFYQVFDWEVYRINKKDFNSLGEAKCLIITQKNNDFFLLT